MKYKTIWDQIWENTHFFSWGKFNDFFKIASIKEGKIFFERKNEAEKFPKFIAKCKRKVNKDLKMNW